jgi:hypothetical protein
MEAHHAEIPGQLLTLVSSLLKPLYCFRQRRIELDTRTVLHSHAISRRF